MPDLIRVRHVEHGPFRGRCYEVNDDGSTGRRRQDLEPRRRRATKSDRSEMAALAASIPDQAALDALLEKVEPHLRDAVLEAWRPHLTFQPAQQASSV